MLAKNVWVIDQNWPKLSGWRWYDLVQQNKTFTHGSEAAELPHYMIESIAADCMNNRGTSTSRDTIHFPDLD